MGVTHIMRGDEFVSSTPKFLALYEALEIKRPYLVTLPPIMGPDGKKKLGKRDGAKDVLTYKEEGYLPEAMLNFLALIGWNPGGEKEVFSKAELTEAFDIAHIHNGGGKFNEEKLEWFNKEHIKRLPPEELENKIFEWLPENYRNEKIIPIIVERISKFGDIKKMLSAGELDFFFKQPIYAKEKLLYKNVQSLTLNKNLKQAIDVLEKLDEKDFTKENIKESLIKVADNLENRGELLHPVRMALSGLDKSPDPFIIAEILGKNETLSRLQKGI